MAADFHVDVSFDGEMSIEFPAEGVTASASVTKVGPGLYRLDSVPVMIESVGFRDVIEVEEINRTSLRFLRVARKSGWRVFEFILAKGAIESERIGRVLGRVEQVGGRWERVWGGCLFICLPPNVGWNPTADVVG